MTRIVKNRTYKFELVVPLMSSRRGRNDVHVTSIVKFAPKHPVLLSLFEENLIHQVRYHRAQNTSTFVKGEVKTVKNYGHWFEIVLYLNENFEVTTK